MHMCKLMKTGSPVLSLYLETLYVNEITSRGYVLRPNLAVPEPGAAVTRPGAAGEPAAPG